MLKIGTAVRVKAKVVIYYDEGAKSDYWLRKVETSPCDEQAIICGMQKISAGQAVHESEYDWESGYSASWKEYNASKYFYAYHVRTSMLGKGFLALPEDIEEIEPFELSLKGIPERLR